MTKLTMKPPRLTEESVSNSEAIKTFAMGAEKRDEKQKTSVKPWENSQIAEKPFTKICTFLVKIPYEYNLKFNYISKMKDISKTKICEKMLIEMIDTEIQKLELIES